MAKGGSRKHWTAGRMWGVVVVAVGAVPMWLAGAGPLTSFTDGDVANAAQVNANFSALANAVDGFFIDASIIGSSITLTADANALPLAASDQVMTVHYGSAQIPCEGTEESSGTTCTGNEQLGIAFDAPTDGYYRVCTDFSWRFSRSSNTHHYTHFHQARTANNDDAIVERGRTAANTWFSYTTTIDRNQQMPVRICDGFAMSAGKNTVRLFAYSNGGAGTRTIRNNPNGAFPEYVHITVEKVGS